MADPVLSLSFQMRKWPMKMEKSHYNHEFTFWFDELFGRQLVCHDNVETFLNDFFMAKVQTLKILYIGITPCNMYWSFFHRDFLKD